MLWANVSDAIAQRMRTESNLSSRLESEHWRSGSNAWLMCAIGDRRGLAALFKRLTETEFKERPLWIRAKRPDGSIVVQSLADAAATKIAA